jgi:hypothetical protein
MRWRRKPTKSKFGKNVLAIHEHWQQVIRSYLDPDEIDEPNFLCLMAATAGATVAIGGYGSYLREHMEVSATELEAAGAQDPTANLADSFDAYAAIEAAWRVACWAVLADLAAFFWRPNYLLELNSCATVFGFENVYERRVVAFGAPQGDRDDIAAEAQRRGRLGRGSLICVIGAATGIDATDSVWIDVALNAWDFQLEEASATASEYLEQVAPDGLPVWEESDPATPRNDSTRPFGCPKCRKSFATENARTAHLRDAHSLE